MSKPLGGIRVAVLLGTSNLVRDSRVRKEARTLSEAGASVTVYCYTQESKVTDGGLLAEPFRTVYVGDIEYESIIPPPSVPEYFEISKPSWPWIIRVPEHLFLNAVYNNPRMKRYGKRYDRWHATYAKWFDCYEQYRPYFMHMELVEKPDIVHANDLDTLYAGAYIARREGAKLIYDSHDLYLQSGWSAEAQDWLSVYVDVEAEYIHQADAVITANDGISDILRQNYGHTAPTIEVYNGCQNVMREPTPVHDPVRFIFSGIFGKNRGLKALVEAFDQLRGQAELTLQGYGGIEGELRSYVKDRRLEDVVFFVDAVEPAQIVPLLHDYDVGVLTWRAETKNLEITAPNKLFDYIGAGLALVATYDLSFIAQLIETHDNGYLFDNTGADSIAEAFRRIIARPDVLSAKKGASIQVAPLYSWEAQSGKLIDLYRKIC